MAYIPFDKEQLSDGIVRWVPYSKTEPVCSRFSIEQWHLSVKDVDSDDELAIVLECNEFLDFYILKLCSDCKSIAFAYIIPHGVKIDYVSIHGGGWGKSMYLSLLYYRGIILLIEGLLTQKRKVRTACDVNNIRAYHFIRSLGFVRYKIANGRFLFWINIERLQNCKIYKYIKTRTL